MGKQRFTKSEICHQLIETILWHLVDSSNEVLTHDRLCRQSRDMVKPKDSVRHLMDVWLVCLENNCPNLALMVVNRNHHLPGDWYYDLYETIHPSELYHRENHFKEEVEKIKSYLDWHLLAEKYELNEDLISRLSLRQRRLKQLTQTNE